MDDSMKKEFADFDWKSFEQFFRGKLPTLPSSGHSDKLDWLDGYVQDVLKQAFPQDLRSIISSRRYPAEVFETLNTVLVKIEIPDKAQIKNLRVLAETNQVKLEGDEVGPQIIKLGTAVIPSSCKAVYRKGILQLQLKKQSGDDRIHEVNVRFQDK